jgi:hypothetical protein
VSVAGFVIPGEQPKRIAMTRELVVEFASGVAAVTPIPALSIALSVEEWKRERGVTRIYEQYGRNRRVLWQKGSK